MTARARYRKLIDGLPRRYRFVEAEDFRVTDVDPADTAGMKRELSRAADALAGGIERIQELQKKLHAQDRWAVLLVFQAMDAAGKDSTISHVMSGVNPAGCQVFSFQEPSKEELDHDYLWRHAVRLPERGRIGIFNRSWYEEVLICRVEPGVLAHEKLAPKLTGGHMWRERYEDINSFERHLARNGTIVLKFFLHVSKEEQRKRFLERIDDPEKNWKFSMDDIAKRGLWNDYMRAYEKMIRATGTKHAPWHVVPADHKWFTRLVVTAVIVDALEALDLRFPKPDARAKAGLAKARKALESEKG